MSEVGCGLDWSGSD